MKLQTYKKIFVFVLLLTLYSFPISALNVTLNSPSNSQNFTVTNNITFNCSATGNYVKNLSLYHNISGSFALNQTVHYGEFGNYSGTLFLCHFNTDLNCYSNTNGTPTTNNTVNFSSGKFNSGVLVDDSDRLAYSSINNINESQGTIEFWYKPSFDIPDVSDHVLYTTGNPPTQNIMKIYVYYEMLVFMIFDSREIESKVQKDVTSWGANEWHHIAAVWDSDSNVSGASRMELYIDGSATGGSVSDDIYWESIQSTMYIGSYSGSQAANGIIDEFRISDIARATEDISQSYQSGIRNYSSVSSAWAFYNMPDGNYSWNCLAFDNNSQSNWSASNYTFFVDVSPPNVTSVAIAPSSADDIDPGSKINVTANISDASVIDTAILQWEEPGTGNWSNVTMTCNISCNASFSVNLPGVVVYDYRIFANDTYGHSVYSSTYNLTADWDYTWSISPPNMSAYGFINNISNVGILQINNTGDVTLNFSFSKNWPLLVKFNEIENSYGTLVPAKGLAYINITAQFAESSSESSMTITITAQRPGGQTPSPNPASRTINATMTSYSGGPYLDLNIASYPASVKQSSTTNISASVKNIGNETANLTVFAWTLPTGWSLSSGNLTTNITDLAAGSTSYNNITVTIDASLATAGLASLSANASVGNVYDSASVSILVNCSSSDGICGLGCSYVNDADCSVPSTGGGGGGVSGLLTIKFGINAATVSRVDLDRGQSKSFLVNVSNTGKSTILYNATLSISGYPLVHIKIIPGVIEKINYNETKQFKIELTAPSYMKYQEVNVKLSVKALSSGGNANETVEKTLELLLVIHETVENETLAYLEKAEACVKAIAASGFPVISVNELLEKARTALNNGDYDEAKTLSEDIILLKASADAAHALIEKLATQVKEAEYNGIAVPETKKLYDLAIAAFGREDYVRAEDRANNAITAYAIESGKLNLVKFIYNNWLVIGLAAILLIIFSILSYNRIMLITVRNNLNSLKKEVAVIKGLMADTQKKHFEGGLSALEYNKGIYEYEKRLAAIEKQRTRLVSKMANLKKPTDVITRFQGDIKNINELIKALQKKYFFDKSLSKSSYEKNISALNTEKIEIQKNIEIVRSKAAEKRKVKAIVGIKNWITRKNILPVLLILLLVVPVNAAGEMAYAQNAIAAAESYIKEMQSLGFGITYANDTLNEAKLLFKNGNYLGAEKTAEYVGTIKATAIRLNQLIDDTETKLYDASSSIDVSPAKELFNSGLAAMKTEDYITAEDLIKKAYNKIDELESAAAMRLAVEKQGFNVVAFIQANLLIIILSLFIAAIVGFFVYKKTEIMALNNKIKNLEIEKNSIEKLLRDTQTRYFELREIGESEYNTAIDKYNQRLIQIKKELPLIAAKLNETKGLKATTVSSDQRQENIVK